MAVAVVDPLEAVKVDEQDGHAAPFPARARQLAVQQIDDGAPVPRLRQRVQPRQPARLGQLGAQALQLAGHARCPAQAACSATRAANSALLIVPPMSGVPAPPASTRSQAARMRSAGSA